VSTITLDDVIARQQQLAAMIEAFKTTHGEVQILVVPEACVELRPGERYAGLVLDDEGKPSHHLVLLPDRAEEVTWDAAVDFAKNAGGELPTRREQSLLYANLKQHFEPAWYWSGEQHEGNGSYAWSQYFYDGNQDDLHKSYEGRAVAVRRLPA
jgi:formylglycine-generating enzyme required for sulfatase activity